MKISLLAVSSLLLLVASQVPAARVGNWLSCIAGDTCNTGYACCLGKDDVKSGKMTCRAVNLGDCVAQAVSSPKPSPAPSSSSTSPAVVKAQLPTTPKVSPSPSPVLPAGIVAVPDMPKGFGGTNKGIGSWFRANAKSSSTNGESWCHFPYKDSSNGFAPDISVMTEGTNVDYFKNEKLWRKYGKRWCGLEAIVTYKGVSRKMYIIDAFDHAWVLTPGSIDVMKNAFTKLFGKSTNNHNDVMKGVTWKLTGNRSVKYSFGGKGDP